MSSTQIEDLREDIQEINKEIIQLIARRVEIANKIGDEKRAEGIPVYQPGQEEKVLSVCRKEAKKVGLNQCAVADLFRSIIAISRQTQKENDSS